MHKNLNTILKIVFVLLFDNKIVLYWFQTPENEKEIKRYKIFTVKNLESQFANPYVIFSHIIRHQGLKFEPRFYLTHVMCFLQFNKKDGSMLIRIMKY